MCKTSFDITFQIEFIQIEILLIQYLLVELLLKKN